MPFCESSFAVPPVERMETFICTSARANSSTPVLSETLIKACLTRMLIVEGGLGCRRRMREEQRLSGDADRGSYPSRLAARPSHLDFQLLDFLAQGVAVDAQPLGRRRLVALGVIEHHLDHGLLDILNHHLVDGARALAVQILEISFQGLAYAFGDLTGARCHAANSSS